MVALVEGIAKTGEGSPYPLESGLCVLSSPISMMNNHIEPISYQWIEPQTVETPPEVLQAAGGDQLLAEALVRRGIRSLEQAAAFLDPNRCTPTRPEELPDLCRAADRIEQAIRTGERIGVWGDFDVDGQTSTTILVGGLRRLGADPLHYIPVRGRESHGIALETLETFLDRGVQLLLTCDTGISAHDAVDYANSRGVETIITDHHVLPDSLPAAYAVLNPQRLPPEHPLRPLCGAGTAFELMRELHARAGKLDELEQDLDLCAMGTVADQAALTGDNRYLVQRGLQRMRVAPRLALQAMLDLANTETGSLNEEHIGFVIGPRLNALGRLGDTNPIVDFLTTQSLESARVTATQLEGLNNRRKLLNAQVLEGALTQIENDPHLLDDPVLVLNHPSWPGGVVGIVASRLVELFHRPAILLTNPPGETAHGSARSVEGINITEALRENASLLLGFGGHAMAAGMSLLAEHIPDLRRGLARSIERMTGGQMPARELAIDAYLDWGHTSLEMVESLDRLSPFGNGNPAFVFASRGLTVQSARLIGKDQAHRSLVVEDAAGNARKVLWWQGADLPLPEGRFDLAYELRATNFRGDTQIQITWVDARALEAPKIPLTVREKVEILDLRRELDPLPALKKRLDAGTLVWLEGEGQPGWKGIQTCGRQDLHACETLVIATIPSGRRELRAALQAAAPKEVVLCGLQPTPDQPEAFLKRLVGLSKHVLSAQEGWVPLAQLAAAMGQREITVEMGLEWLAARGFVHLAERDEGRIRLETGRASDPQALKQAEVGLKYLLQETSAFRAYYLRVGADLLVKK